MMCGMALIKMRRALSHGHCGTLRTYESLCR
jgi:hypothetical protein